MQSWIYDAWQEVLTELISSRIAGCRHKVIDYWIKRSSHLLNIQRGIYEFWENICVTKTQTTLEIKSAEKMSFNAVHTTLFTLFH